MQKVLLVDTNFSSLPIYKSLLGIGFDVFVVGGNPSDCLAKISPNYIQLDYSNKEKMQQLVKENQFKYLIPGCTDKSYETCAAIAHTVGAGIDSTKINEQINRKDLFRELADTLSLSIPKLHAKTQQAHRWPLVVKPVDGFSGHGITVLKNEDRKKLAGAIEFAKENSHSKEYLIEDYVDGQLYSHSAFIENRKVKTDFIVREDRTVNPFVVDTSAVCVDFPSKILASLRNDIEKIANFLKLNNGLVHTQFIARDDEYWLIEMTRRCPGDLYSQLITLSTGFNYTDHYASSFVGRQLQAGNTLEKKRIIRHTITVSESQNFADLSFSMPIKIVKMINLSMIGEYLKPSPYSRVGIVFIEASSQTEFEEIYGKIIQRSLYRINS